MQGRRRKGKEWRGLELVGDYGGWSGAQEGKSPLRIPLPRKSGTESGAAVIDVLDFRPAEGAVVDADVVDRAGEIVGYRTAGGDQGVAG
jgi:hypothetical protein